MIHLLYLEGERTLLVHLALDEVELVPGVHGEEAKEAVLRLGALGAVVERHLALSADLEKKRKYCYRY